MRKEELTINNNSDHLETGSDETQLLGFKVGDESFAINILEVQEVVKAQRLTEIPLSVSTIKGLINLRGQVVTTLDMRAIFGLKHNDDYMNIIVSDGEILYALTVDEILDVITVHKGTYEPPPETLNENIGKYVSGVYKLEGKILINLDLKKILQ